ncbi:MAG TPA: 4'-phosphopantetheinyl transferase superfamily protein [Thermoleophilaceae bacterium]|nr:4'-phosphopantetheinyl transferase superfamily protein [Thermoleophilaceae bacterium]
MTTLPAAPEQPRWRWPLATEAHVYFAPLDRPVFGAATTLSDDERARAARFHFDRDRRRFIAGRALLRSLLGNYLETPPHKVAFRYDPNGKPRLTGGELSFNVSHSHSAAVFAFTSERGIGVDIERHPAPDDGDAVARHFFAAAEVTMLDSLPAAARSAAFLRCWTRKEAYIKARGDGLSLPLDSFEVSLAPGAGPALLATRPDPVEAGRWSLVDLSRHCPGYVAALAFEGGDPTLTIAHV